MDSFSCTCGGKLTIRRRLCSCLIRELLKTYNSSPDAIPDPRLVTYFTENPKSDLNYFDDAKILAFVADEEVSLACTYCGTQMFQNGWRDLCNRQCYYGICELLRRYNSGLDAIPDPRIVAYFTKNPNSGHQFDDKKILTFIAI
jgi:hypothetical protein